MNLGLPKRHLQRALRRAIADRRGYIDVDDDEVGWVVFLLSPDRAEFRGDTLCHALNWCLVWLMEEEFSGGELC